MHKINLIIFPSIYIQRFFFAFSNTKHIVVHSYFYYIELLNCIYIQKKFIINFLLLALIYIYNNFSIYLCLSRTLPVPTRPPTHSFFFFYFSNYFPLTWKQRKKKKKRNLYNVIYNNFFLIQFKTQSKEVF